LISRGIARLSTRKSLNMYRIDSMAIRSASDSEVSGSERRMLAFALAVRVEVSRP
jgi:hypothetical protein